jgi:hypothetical protein
MHRFFLTLVVVLGLAAPAIAADSTSASASVVVNANFSTRTSLKVSSQMLQFSVPSGDETARVEVDFTAAARTRAGGEVILLVESFGPLDDGSAGSADVTFTGEGPGTGRGAIAVDSATPVARWIGSGLRTGRLTFTLRAVAGRYTVPVRFLLAAP